MCTHTLVCLLVCWCDLLSTPPPPPLKERGPYRVCAPGALKTQPDCEPVAQDGRQAHLLVPFAQSREIAGQMVSSDSRHGQEGPGGGGEAGA